MTYHLKPPDELMVDVHRELAARMFDVLVAEVTPEQRRLAKVQAFYDLYHTPPVLDRVRPNDLLFVSPRTGASTFQLLKSRDQNVVRANPGVVIRWDSVAMVLRDLPEPQLPIVVDPVDPNPPGSKLLHRLLGRV